MKHIKNFNESISDLRLKHDFSKDYRIHKSAGRKPYIKKGFKLIEIKVEDKYKMPECIVFLTEDEASKLNELGENFQKEIELKNKLFDSYIYRVHKRHYDVSPELKDRDSGIKYEDDKLSYKVK